VDSLEATRNLLGYLGAVEDGESRGNDPMFHGKIIMFHGKIHYKSQFLIAMLVYQRVS